MSYFGGGCLRPLGRLLLIFGVIFAGCWYGWHTIEFREALQLADTLEAIKRPILPARPILYEGQKLAWDERLLPGQKLADFRWSAWLGDWPLDASSIECHGRGQRRYSCQLWLPPLPKGEYEASVTVEAYGESRTTHAIVKVPAGMSA